MTDAPVSHRPPNQLGVHALVWTGSWDAASAQAACAATAAAGYDLIEIPLLDPTEVDPAMTRAALESAGLGATCSLGLAPDTDISSADGTVVARGEKLLHAALEVSAAIGSRYLGGVTYSAMTKCVVPPTPAGRANSVSVLRGLAQEARSRGVPIGNLWSDSGDLATHAHAFIADHLSRPHQEAS